MTKYTDEEKKRRRLNKIKINDLSTVTKPMQEGATAVIMKRADEGPVLLTTPDDSGHSHLIQFNHEYRSNETSYASAKPGEGSHDHPYVLKDGAIVIGEANGHSHEVDSDEVIQALITVAMISAIKEDLERSENSTFKSLAGTETLLKSLEVSSTNQPASDGGVSKSEVVMSDPKNETVPSAELDALKKSVTTLQDELKIAKAIGELSDVEKAHWLSLDKAEASAFLELDSGARTSQIELLKAADPVVYTAEDGEVFFKSDDSRLVKMAKDRDADRKIAKADREKAETLEFTKRAETELGFMPGTVETRIELLKCVETITDEAVKTEVLKSIAAKNTSLGKNFELVGESGETPIDKAESGQELEVLAKAYMAEKGGSYVDAYAVVGELHPKLLEKAYATS